MSHQIQSYVTEPVIEWDQLPISQMEHLLIVHKVIFTTNMQSCQCPFPGCPRTSHGMSGLCSHFNRLHCGIVLVYLYQKNNQRHLHTLNTDTDRCPHEYWIIAIITLQRSGWDSNATDGGRHWNGALRKTWWISGSIWTPSRRQPHYHTLEGRQHTIIVTGRRFISTWVMTKGGGGW